ncbi:hypothetical protein [Oceanobacter mangrovi]|uniref:hypothetical protein n=1 Tax=Oceanobacter mangrovi TaxID=2862510 RepID=UPI001C8D803D|nr:hypothetical protein [Oceanobacter mangrovi]
MFPWMFFWAPQLNMPWSGNVAQDISPTTSWFTDHIQPQAGDAEVEEKVFEIASYGEQLGLINKVLLDLVDKQDLNSAKAQQALEKLHTITTRVAEVKQQSRENRLKRILDDIDKLREANPQAYEELRKRMAL